MNGAVRAALETLKGNVLEIGSSGMHDAYSKGVSVDVYEPKKRIREDIRTKDVDATISALEVIPTKKYEAIVVPYMYEMLKKQKAQELSAIIGTRMVIGAPLIIIEHVRGGLFKRLFGRWTGTTIEDTDHGLKKIEEHTEHGVRLRVYKRVVLK